MDAPVAAALITAGAALVVAVGNGLRGAVGNILARRNERRHDFLVEVQNAMLVLREALAEYGVALRNDLGTGTGSGLPGLPGLPGQAGPQGASLGVVAPPGGASLGGATSLGGGTSGSVPSTATSFTLAVPQAVSLRVTAARGRLAVARSRVDDDTVDAAVVQWEKLAQANLIDAHDTQTAAEEAAFAQVNELIRSALRSQSGTVDRHTRRRFGRRAG